MRSAGVFVIIVVLIVGTVALSTLWESSPGQPVEFSRSVNPMRIRNAAGEFFYDSVKTSFSISPSAPYYLSLKGTRMVRLGIVAQLFDSAGNLLDTTYASPSDVAVPSATLGYTIAWYNFLDYPGFPSGTYGVELTAYICPSTPIAPFSGCTVASQITPSQFVIP